MRLREMIECEKISILRFFCLVMKMGPLYMKVMITKQVYNIIHGMSMLNTMDNINILNISSGQIYKNKS